MQNNYFLLRQLVPLLRERITGFRTASVFSQNKDELVLIFSNDRNIFTIKALMGSDFTCLSFPEDFKRARKNSVNLFEQIKGLAVAGLRNFSFDRSFALDFENDYSLIFKLYGNRSNILLFKGNACVDIFKQNLKSDHQLKPDDFGKTLDFSRERFEACSYDLKAFLPVLGKPFQFYFEKKDYERKTPDEKWKLIRQLLKELDHPDYCIKYMDGIPVLLLYDGEDTVETFTNPIKALNAFSKIYTRQIMLFREKASLLRMLRGKIRKNDNYIRKTGKKLKQLKTQTAEAQIADIIMANLHNIPSHAKEITLYDFYNDREITITLKSHLSPQKNAEAYYRKAKNKQIEVNNLESNLQARKEANEALSNLLKQVEQARDIRQLRKLAGASTEGKAISADEEGFHSFEYIGYRILVGKNAKRNDQLTFKVARKDDLWLHVRDAVGSHVIIRRKPGGNIPKSVIERAASLAAFYSKRKNEALCPVMYTERKYVRKTRHLAPGEVIVDREKTILVSPQDGETK